jgi:hypothetical protein
MKTYDVIIETKEIHRIESYGDNETDSVGKALDLLDVDVPLSNRGISYSIFDVLLKDEYLN